MNIKLVKLYWLQFLLLKIPLNNSQKYLNIIKIYFIVTCIAKRNLNWFYLLNSFWIDSFKIFVYTFFTMILFHNKKNHVLTVLNDAKNFSFKTKLIIMYIFRAFQIYNIQYYTIFFIVQWTLKTLGT